MLTYSEFVRAGLEYFHENKRELFNEYERKFQAKLLKTEPDITTTPPPPIDPGELIDARARFEQRAADWNNVDEVDEDDREACDAWERVQGYLKTIGAKNASTGSCSSASKKRARR